MSTRQPTSNGTSNDTFLSRFEDLIGVHNDALAIIILSLIFLGTLLILILIIVICCVCKSLRNAAKKKKRPKMNGVWENEIPGTEGSAKAIVGNLEYALEYDMRKAEFKVTIIQACDLQPPAGSSGCDPYAKLFFETLPHADEDGNGSEAPKKLSKIFKTKHKEDTQNPTWSESFLIPIPYESIETAVLVIEIFDYDTIGHDMKMGRIMREMRSLEMVNFLNKRLEVSDSIEIAETEYTGLGDLCVILRQSPNDNQLHVTILEAKRLSFDTKYSNLPPVQVSVTLLINNSKKLANKKTSWRRNTRNPYYSETMIFSIKSSNLSVASVNCSLKYKNEFGVSKCLGKVNLGIQSVSTSGKKHWQEMLEQPRKAIAMWHGFSHPKFKAIDED